MKLADDCPPEGFARLADVPSIVRIDLSGREDVTDEDVAFLASMPWLAAVSLAGCRRLTDRAAVYAPARRARAAEPEVDRAGSAWSSRSRRERRFVVDGDLRHSWQGDFSAFRGRIGIGLVRAGTLTLRAFTLGALT